MLINLRLKPFMQAQNKYHQRKQNLETFQIVHSCKTTTRNQSADFVSPRYNSVRLKLQTVAVPDKTKTMQLSKVWTVLVGLPSKTQTMATFPQLSDKKSTVKHMPASCV